MITYNPKKIASLYAKSVKFAKETGAHGRIKIPIDMQRKYTRRDLDAVLQQLHPTGGGFSLGWNDTGIKVTDDLDLFFSMNKEKD